MRIPRGHTYSFLSGERGKRAEERHLCAIVIEAEQYFILKQNRETRVSPQPKSNPGRKQGDSGDNSSGITPGDEQADSGEPTVSKKPQEMNRETGGSQQL